MLYGASISLGNASIWFSSDSSSFWKVDLVLEVIKRKWNYEGRGN